MLSLSASVIKKSVWGVVPLSYRLTVLLKHAEITRELSLRTISANGRESVGKLPLETSNCSCCHILGFSWFALCDHDRPLSDGSRRSHYLVAAGVLLRVPFSCTVSRLRVRKARWF